MHEAMDEEVKCLREFLAQSVRRGTFGFSNVKPREDVTALVYFFWPVERSAEKWPLFEGAIFQTWRTCGLLKTVIVTNDSHECLVDFSARFKNVEIQREPSLVPGNINTMSIDCNARLYTRFTTPYVLIVQEDGFPLRAGLDAFVDCGYDFIGSPYCRALPFPNLMTRVLNYCPSNGGFSLRTRRFCEMVAAYWRRDYASRPFVVDEMSEDLFYTKTLPRRFLSLWFRRRQAPSIISEQFSFEGALPLYTKTMPFGFHTATGFSLISNKFLER